MEEECNTPQDFENKRGPLTEYQAEQLQKLLERLRKATIRFQPLKRISLGESALLKVLDDHERNERKITATMLSDCLSIKKPAASRMLNAMEEKGYTMRVYEKKDRRKVYIELTELGRQVLQEEQDHYRAILSVMVNQMGEELMKEMLRSGEKFCSVLESIEMNVDEKPGDILM